MNDSKFVLKVRLSTLLACVLAFAGIEAAAQTASYVDEYKLRIEEGSRLTPADLDSSFGEQIDEYSGRGKFVTRDLDVIGNNQLPVNVVRSRDVKFQRIDYKTDHLAQYRTNGFRDWELLIPHIRYVLGAGGWNAASGESAGVRCNISSQARLSPPSAPTILQQTESPLHYSTGPSIRLSDGTARKILYRVSGGVVPNTSEVYKWVTSDYWALSCLSSTSNGIPGDAFLATSPDGVKYWFDHAVQRNFDALSGGIVMISSSDPGDPPTYEFYQDSVLRIDARMYVSKMEDRHGNWVKYIYDQANPWRLLTVDASDGRRIDFTYTDGRITKAKSVDRFVDYTYSSTYATLATVQYADNSGWTYDFSKLHLTDYSVDGVKKCGTPDTLYPDDRHILITAPSGATGDFVFSPLLQGRTYVPKECYDFINPNTGKIVATRDRYPAMFLEFSLTKRTVSGLGLTPMTWSWEHPSLTYGYLENCSSPCPTSKKVTLTKPDGSKIETFFGIKFSYNDGMVLERRYYSADSSLLETKTFDRVLDASGYPFGQLSTAYPVPVFEESAKYPHPFTQTTTYRLGRVFRRQNSDFDVFARPRVITSSSQ